MPQGWAAFLGQCPDCAFRGLEPDPHSGSETQAVDMSLQKWGLGGGEVLACPAVVPAQIGHAPEHPTKKRKRGFLRGVGQQPKTLWPPRWARASCMSLADGAGQEGRGRGQQPCPERSRRVQNSPEGFPCALSTGHIPETCPVRDTQGPAASLTLSAWVLGLGSLSHAQPGLTCVCLSTGLSSPSAARAWIPVPGTLVYSHLSRNRGSVSLEQPRHLTRVSEASPSWLWWHRDPPGHHADQRGREMGQG